MVKELKIAVELMDGDEMDFEEFKDLMVHQIKKRDNKVNVKSLEKTLKQIFDLFDENSKIYKVNLFRELKCMC